MQLAVKVVVLDRVLATYGPEANEIRITLKNGYTAATQQLSSGDENKQAKLAGPEAYSRLENIQTRFVHFHQKPRSNEVSMLVRSPSRAT